MRRLRDPDNQGILPPLMIIGNKNDLEDQRVITKAEGESFTQKVGDDVIFMETSAKNNTNIDKVKIQTENYLSFYRYFLADIRGHGETSYQEKEDGGGEEQQQGQQE